MNNMMDLIDRNLIGDMVDSNGNVHYEDIMGIPSEVIHCKDCIYSCKNACNLGFKIIQDNVVYCKEHRNILNDNEFCSRGKRHVGN